MEAQVVQVRSVSLQLAMLHAPVLLFFCCAVHLLKSDFAAFYSDPRSPLIAEQSVQLCWLSNAKHSFVIRFPCAG